MDEVTTANSRALNHSIVVDRDPATTTGNTPIIARDVIADATDDDTGDDLKSRTVTLIAFVVTWQPSIIACSFFVVFVGAAYAGRVPVRSLSS
jgi:hypothetical protein